MRRRSVGTIAALALVVACRETPRQELPVQQLQEQLIKVNRAKHQAETQLINSFVAAKQWPMSETTTGLRIWIYSHGNGPEIDNGDQVWVAYSVELLDGTKCYERTVDEPERITVGQDYVESGLHEALLLMRAGDKAKLIIPSHLAFGLTGDSGKIPGDAALVYDIELLHAS